jgi:excinuclease UvrABC helicase subunit UvrB
VGILDADKEGSAQRDIAYPDDSPRNRADIGHRILYADVMTDSLTKAISKRPTVAARSSCASITNTA